MASLSTRNASAAAALSLHYGDTLAVRLRLPATPTPPLREIAEEYFDSEGLLKPEQFRQFEKVMEQLRRVDDTAVVYSDVLEFERKMLARLKRGRDPLKGLLKVPLFPYQVRGALFAACRGRVALADDMGPAKPFRQ